MASYVRCRGRTGTAAGLRVGQGRCLTNFVCFFHCPIIIFCLLRGDDGHVAVVFSGPLLTLAAGEIGKYLRAGCPFCVTVCTLPSDRRQNGCRVRVTHEIPPNLHPMSGMAYVLEGTRFMVIG